MAITATWTQERRERVGRQKHVTGYFTLTGAASAGGFAISAATFSLSRLDDFVVSGGSVAGTGGTTALLPVFDKAASKISLFEGGATANDNPFDETDLASTATYIVRGTAKGA